MIATDTPEKEELENRKKSPALKKVHALKKKVFVESSSSESDKIDENITQDSSSEWDEFE